jgi:hypothetical protein
VSDDLLGSLQRLQQRASQLQALMSDVRSRTPQTATSTDRSGAVTVTLGPDGFPATIRVAADWRRRIDPSALGNAVVEAGQPQAARD